MNKTFMEIIQIILTITIPYIKKLIQSKVVPIIKRKAYEAVNDKIDKLINDLAQNASKIAGEKDELKKIAYIEGTKLGIDTIRAIADKLNQAADEIGKAL